MLKKHAKIIVTLFAIISLISVFCFSVKATDDAPVTTSEEPISDTTEETPINDGENSEDETHTDEILYKDLYILKDNVTMDQTVDGNVYILGNNVKITGKVNGNLFVLGRNVEFGAPYAEDDTEHQDGNYCYIAGSVFVCTDKLTFNAIAQDVYAVCNTFNMAYDSYIMRDVRLAAAKVIMKGYITRDVYLVSDNIDFGTPSENEEEESECALISGNLHYTSSSEIEIPEDIVQGQIKFTKNDTSDDDTEKSSKTVADYLLNLLEVIIYTFVVYLLIIWLVPKFFENSANELRTSALLTLGIGLISLIVPFVVASILLLLLFKLSLTMFVVYGLLIAMSFTVVAGSLTYLLKDKLGFENRKLLLLLIITIILWALKQIPFIGGIITFAITTFGLGLTIKNIINRNQRLRISSSENK